MNARERYPGLEVFDVADEVLHELTVARVWECAGCAKRSVHVIRVVLDADAPEDYRWVPCLSCSEGGWVAIPAGERVVPVSAIDPGRPA